VRLPWNWLYDIGQRVEINDKAKFYFSEAVGKKGQIEELLRQGSVDYGVRTDDGSLYAVKESELTIIPEEVNE
jgi:hypothetical protein